MTQHHTVSIKLSSLLSGLLLACLLSLTLVQLSPQPAQAQEPKPRRVNIPYFDSDVTWAQTAIFWFGENKQGIPGKNYVDVRTAYTNNALHIRVTVVDYYLWNKRNPQPTDDLTEYDAVALYLDINRDRATTPQVDDYMFLRGARQWDAAVDHQRQARGNGTGWDNTWSGTWNSWGGMSWSSGAPNDNSGGIDFGWTAGFVIPWATVGLAGPPSEGTVWGLGVQLYDRDDQPPAGYVTPESWPETLNTDSPTTWGELHFGYAGYQPPPATPVETTMIRAATPVDNTVEDAWMGGGGYCAGGHNGGTEVNHGDDESLYVGTETAETHFPCFNKSYLRFSLDDIPPGKEIISATLTLHHHGNAGQSSGLAEPSWVSLFTVSDPWEEMTIHWNNAPLAQENVAATWIQPLPSFPGWPGIPYDWDATQAVAEAYAAGKPVSLAIYGSDSARDSSKYLTSSETGINDPPAYWNWNEESRPTLNVLWGNSLGGSFTLNRIPSTQVIDAGGVATYTIQIQHSDNFTHNVKLQVGTSPSPDLLINLAEPTDFSPLGGETTLTLTDTHDASFSSEVWYIIPLTAAGGGITQTTSVQLFVNGTQIYLPLIMKMSVISNQ